MAGQILFQAEEIVELNARKLLRFNG